MTATTLDDGVRVALRSIDADRLALLLGAGLSIPSGLPSAWRIAQDAKRTYDAKKAPSDPPLSPDIETQADFFFQTGELESFYIQSLVDKNAFAGPPNEGHTAVADFLLAGAVRAAVSTNYDTLIEGAGLALLGTVEVALSGADTALAKGVPLLKIHGCWSKDQLNTVWTPSQLDTPGVVCDRIATSEGWLATNLPNRDLLVVGFWTDWSYLNEVIGRSLGQITPARVVIVDLEGPDELRNKAPQLAQLGDRASRFLHVRESSATFFKALREAFSRSYVRQAVRAGEPAYLAQSGGTPPDPAWFDPAFADNNVLWHVRRDIEGCRPTQPAGQRTPPPGDAVGLAMLDLQAAGAHPEGPYWRLGPHLVRVINGSGRTLHAMKGDYDREMTQHGPDLAIAVGAVDSVLPGNASRPNEGTSDVLPPPARTFVRSAPPHWITSTADLPATP